MLTIALFKRTPDIGSVLQRGLFTKVIRVEQKILGIARQIGEDQAIAREGDEADAIARQLLLHECSDDLGRTK